MRGNSKKWFVIGLTGLVAVEIALVYFIMPFPGSQRMASVRFAHALYRWRWLFRAAFGALLLAGAPSVWRAGGWRRWTAAPALVVALLIAYTVGFRMRADRIFLQVGRLVMAPASENAVAPERLVIGIDLGGEARAYPIQLIGYHHQVRDVVGGQPVMVTYCTVCRTGRAFSPVVNGAVEEFRLVGMDRFNAMFEDSRTGSWWRQATGRAVAGPLKGSQLSELPSRQMTLARWLALYPQSRIMQPNTFFTRAYPQDMAFEDGTSRSSLTGTDPGSWAEKSWVVGIDRNGRSKAWDWNDLKRLRVINDTVGDLPVVLALASDGVSFVAFERPDARDAFELHDDALVGPGGSYDLGGEGPSGRLTHVPASQEFWHSWRTFHPDTERFTDTSKP